MSYNPFFESWTCERMEHNSENDSEPIDDKVMKVMQWRLIHKNY